MMNKIIDIYPVKKETLETSLFQDSRMRIEYLNNEFCLTFEGKNDTELRRKIKAAFKFICVNRNYVLYSRWTGTILYCEGLDDILSFNLETV